MPSSFKEIVRTWLFIMVISSTAVIVLGSSGEKKFNIKIGFDLTQGENGAPSLRIRDFEDSPVQNVRRAHDIDDESQEHKPKVKTVIRADSVSESEEVETADPIEVETADPIEVETPKPEPSKESSDESDEDNEYSDETRPSTRGLNAEDYEPEEKAGKVHVQNQQDSDEDSDKKAVNAHVKHQQDSDEDSDKGSNRRRKRNALLNVMRDVFRRKG